MLNQTFHVDIKFYNYFPNFQLIEIVEKEDRLSRVCFDCSPIVHKNQTNFYFNILSYCSILPQHTITIANLPRSLVYVAHHHFAYKDILQLQIHLKMDS